MVKLFNRIFHCVGRNRTRRTRNDTNLVPVKDKLIIQLLMIVKMRIVVIIENDSMSASVSNAIFTPDPSQTGSIGHGY